LVAPEQLAVPIPVIPLTVDLDVEPSSPRAQGKVQQELLLCVLGYRAQSGFPQVTVEDALPVRDEFRLRDWGIVGAGTRSARAAGLLVWAASEVLDVVGERGAWRASLPPNEGIALREKLV
jgi:hypothetical protein